VALREWLRAYRCYYEQSKFDQTTDFVQTPVLLACLEPKLAMRIRPKANRTSAVLNPVNGDEDPTSLETLLRQEFEMFDSVFARRYRLLGKRHQKGIKLSDWWERFAPRPTSATSPASRQICSLLSSSRLYCAVPEQQDELMKTDGTLENVLKAMYSFEKRCGDVKTTRGVDPSGVVAAARGGCQSCGGLCRPGDVCPAKGNACTYCGRQNHYAAVCRKKASDQANGITSLPRVHRRANQRRPSTRRRRRRVSPTVRPATVRPAPRTRSPHPIR
jgi:hypothetical protein